MKKILSIAVLSALALGSCTKMPEYVEQEEFPELSKEQIDQNVQNVFGTTFDPNHDWTMTTTGSIKIKADANFANIVKVQVLSESPYLNTNAMILNEAAASQGETVELTYEAPKGSTRLIAACVNNLGEYFIKGFDITDQQVSFSSLSSAMTRGENDITYPNPSDIKLEYKNSSLSYNAQRAIAANGGNTNANISAWKNSGWENERLWRLSNSSSTSNGWSIVQNSVVREIGPMSEEEKTALDDILETSLGGKSNLRNHYNNIEAVRNTNIFQLYDNYLSSDGTPVVLTPILTSSTELGDLYYYYFNPEYTYNLSSEQFDNYIKSLPKFKAFHGAYTRNAAKEKGYVDNQNKGFFKLHQYILPYYGDYTSMIGDLGRKDISTFCNTDGKVYRIRNGRQLNNLDYYMVYTGDDNKKLATKYEDNADNIKNQLWQVFTTKEGGYKLLYNIGAQKFLVRHFTAGNDWTSTFTSDYETIMKSLFTFDDNNHIWRFDQNGVGLGTDLAEKNNNFKIATNKMELSDKDKNPENSKWYFEEFTDGVVADTQIKFDIKVDDRMAESFVIPKGYRIGFMHRKEGNFNSTDYENATNRGETYGDGSLNKQINTFPNFSTAINTYGMKLTDPRFAIFKANGKKYMTLEDGTDCNFTDCMFEINSGVQEEPDPLIVNVGVYTFCFEDRQDGDYDLNDVIIKAMRLDRTHVLFSLEACGAYDELYLRNIHGKVLNSTTEIHKMFSVDNIETFINTQGGERKSPIQEVVTVKENYSFSNTGPDQIYIHNATTGRDIYLSTTGEDPHGLMIPADFQYPVEKTSINQANESFLKWAEGDNGSYNWYNNSILDKVCQDAKFEISDGIKKAYPQYFSNDN